MCNNFVAFYKTWVFIYALSLPQSFRSLTHTVSDVKHLLASSKLLPHTHTRTALLFNYVHKTSSNDLLFHKPSNFWTWVTHTLPNWWKSSLRSKESESLCKLCACLFMLMCLFLCGCMNVRWLLLQAKFPTGDK